MTIEHADSRERWRAALEVYLARKERTATLRAQLAAARAAGKRARHADRLARLARESTTTDGRAE